MLQKIFPLLLLLTGCTLQLETLKAMAGNKEAQYQQGLKYQYGGSVDHALAAKWFLKAADKGHDKAQYELGLMYGLGQVNTDLEGNRGNVESETTYFTKSAEQGNPRAQYELASLLRNSYDEEVVKQAFNWFLKSAHQGLPNAQYCLATMYDHGEGVLKDTKAAFRWYTLSANNGVPEAQEALAEIYYTGNLVQKDTESAYIWASLAEEKIAIPDSLKTNVLASKLSPKIIASANRTIQKLHEKIDRGSFGLEPVQDK